MAILLRGVVAAPACPVFLRVLGAWGGRKRPPFTRAPKTQWSLGDPAYLVGAFSPDPFPVSPVPAGDGERRETCGVRCGGDEGCPSAAAYSRRAGKQAAPGLVAGRSACRAHDAIMVIKGRGKILLTFEHTFDIM